MGRWRSDKRQAFAPPPGAKVDRATVEQLLRQQQAGEAHFGEALAPPDERRQTQYTAPFAFALWQREPPQPAERPLDFRQFKPQPAEKRPSNGETAAAIVEVLGGWRPPAFSEDGFFTEESELVAEAKALNKSWQEIAALLPGRNASQIRRHFNLLQQKKKQKMLHHRHRQASAAVMGASGVGSGAVTAARFTGTAVAAATAPTRALAAAAPPVLADAREPVAVDPRCTNREGGDRRVKMKRPLARPPSSHTVLQAHRELLQKGLDGVTFYDEVEVVDPDDPAKTYAFAASHPHHAPCFNIGEGPDGSPLIGWSQLVALYVLPDGTKWAEHYNLLDAEDLAALEGGRSPSSLVPPDTTEQELFKRKGRFHSRLQNIEYECWIYGGSLPATLAPEVSPSDAYYWRVMFDADTMEAVTAA